jgi:hypothetical protein
MAGRKRAARRPAAARDARSGRGGALGPEPGDLRVDQRGRERPRPGVAPTSESGGGSRRPWRTRQESRGRCPTARRNSRACARPRRRSGRERPARRSSSTTAGARFGHRRAPCCSSQRGVGNISGVWPRARSPRTPGDLDKTPTRGCGSGLVVEGKGFVGPDAPKPSDLATPPLPEAAPSGTPRPPASTASDPTSSPHTAPIRPPLERAEPNGQERGRGAKTPLSEGRQESLVRESGQKRTPRRRKGKPDLHDS